MPALCISCRASEPKRQNINLHKKWGFRRFQKECHKVRRTALFTHFLRKKCGFLHFSHFLVLFLESAETPLFVQINIFAAWALRLDRKYTMPATVTAILSWRIRFKNSSHHSYSRIGVPILKGTELLSANSRALSLSKNSGVSLVQSNSVPSRLLPNSCLLNPGRGPKSNRTSRLFPGSF